MAIKGDKGVTEFYFASSSGVYLEAVVNKIEFPDMGKL